MDTITNWLQKFPYWEDAIYLDHMEPTPGNCGLYALGMEMVDSKEDILGNKQQRLRIRFQLRRVTPRQKDNAAHVQWMQDFQLWVLNQNAIHKAPQLGNRTEWSAKNGKLAKSDRPDTCIYTVDLWAEYDI